VQSAWDIVKDMPLAHFFKKLGFFGRSRKASSNGVDEPKASGDNLASPVPSTDAVKNMIRTRCGYVTITGNFRSNNEDNFHVDPDGRFFIVADGMGGQSAGEKASQLATELVPEKLKQLINFEKDASESVRQAIDEAVGYANTEIMALGKLEPEFHNMGTTIVFVVAVDNLFYVGGVGDSRAYLLRDGDFEQLTRDHSLTQALKEAGTLTEEEAANHRYKNVLYRYLGTKEGGTGTDPREIFPKTGDRFLLCSDGVTDGVEDEDLKKLLSASDDPQEVAKSLVDAAEAGGSRDNITCLVVFVD
jgi:serine/threonine protein phosphatase PrpC